MRKLVLGLVAATALGSASMASATQFMGATAGCFGAACAPAGAATIPGSGLTFTSGSFNQADSNGFLAIGSGTENFGTLNLPAFRSPTTRCSRCWSTSLFRPEPRAAARFTRRWSAVR